MRDLVAPMIDVARRRAGGRRVRVVDLGCGMGFVVRWLAARGGLGPDVELIGADCNRALVTAAQRLAEEERLDCRFVAGNAFALREPADVIISIGVLHHFRGDELAAVFAQHERSPATGFVHVDIRPSPIAPIGSWIFHRARMRRTPGPVRRRAIGAYARITRTRCAAPSRRARPVSPSRSWTPILAWPGCCASSSRPSACAASAATSCVRPMLASAGGSIWSIVTVISVVDPGAGEMTVAVHNMTIFALASLALFDVLLSGMRAAAGRDGRIAKPP